MDNVILISNTAALTFNIQVITNYDRDMTVVVEYVVIQTVVMLWDLAAIILGFYQLTG